MRAEPRSRILLAAALLLLATAAGWLLYGLDRRQPAPSPAAADRIEPAAPVPVAAAPTRSTAARDQRRAPNLTGDNDEERHAVVRLRELAVSDPRQALALGADLDRRFADGAFAEERASLAIDALVNLGDIGQARDASEEYFVRFRNGRFGPHVETLTGVHPHAAGDDAP